MKIKHAARVCVEVEALMKRHRFTGNLSTVPLLASADFRLAQFGAVPADRSKEWAAKRAVKTMWRQGKNVRDDGAVERYRVAGTLAWLLGQRERATSLWSTGLEHSASLDARYARARILFERGRRANAAVDLQQAARLFAACEALRERGQAERLLASDGHQADTAAMDPVAAT